MLPDSFDSLLNDRYYLRSSDTGFRNKFINGDFNIWQRGTTFSTNNTYTADRWYMALKSGTTATRETLDLPLGFRYGFKFTNASSTSGPVLGQFLESETVISLRDKLVTFSFWVKTNRFTGNITPSVFWSSGGDTISSYSLLGKELTDLSIKSFGAPSNWTRVSTSFTVPKRALGLEVRIECGENVTAGSTTIITGAQLEMGSFVTPFEYRPIGTELALCQRYYQTSFSGTGVAPAHNASSNGSIYHSGVSGGISGNLYTNLTFSQMRVAPVVSIFNANNASATPASGVLAAGLNTSASGIRCYTAGGAGFDSTNIGIDFIRPESVSLYAQGASGAATAGILAFGYSLNAEL
jgi:hypothetical protein